MDIVQVINRFHAQMLTVLHMWIDVVQRMRRYRTAHMLNDNSERDFIVVNNLISDLTINWLNLCKYLLNFVRSRKLRRQLMKPHLLLQCFVDYR